MNRIRIFLAATILLFAAPVSANNENSSSSGINPADYNSVDAYLEDRYQQAETDGDLNISSVYNIDDLNHDHINDLGIGFLNDWYDEKGFSSLDEYIDFQLTVDDHEGRIELNGVQNNDDIDHDTLNALYIGHVNDWYDNNPYETEDDYIDHHLRIYDATHGNGVVDSKTAEAQDKLRDEYIEKLKGDWLALVLNENPFLITPPEPDYTLVEFTLSDEQLATLDSGFSDTNSYLDLSTNEEKLAEKIKEAKQKYYSEAPEGVGEIGTTGGNELSQILIKIINDHYDQHGYGDKDEYLRHKMAQFWITAPEGEGEIGENSDEANKAAEKALDQWHATNGYDSKEDFINHQMLKFWNGVPESELDDEGYEQQQKDAEQAYRSAVLGWNRYINNMDQSQPQNNDQRTEGRSVSGDTTKSNNEQYPIATWNPDNVAPVIVAIPGLDPDAHTITTSLFTLIPDDAPKDDDENIAPEALEPAADNAEKAKSLAKFDPAIVGNGKKYSSTFQPDAGDIPVAGISGMEKTYGVDYDDHKDLHGDFANSTPPSAPAVPKSGPVQKQDGSIDWGNGFSTIFTPSGTVTEGKDGEKAENKNGKLRTFDKNGNNTHAQNTRSYNQPLVQLAALDPALLNQISPAAGGVVITDAPPAINTLVNDIINDTLTNTIDGTIADAINNGGILVAQPAPTPTPPVTAPTPTPTPTPTPPPPVPAAFFPDVNAALGTYLIAFKDGFLNNPSVTQIDITLIDPATNLVQYNTNGGLVPPVQEVLDIQNGQINAQNVFDPVAPTTPTNLNGHFTQNPDGTYRLDGNYQVNDRGGVQQAGVVAEQQ